MLHPYYDYIVAPLVDSLHFIKIHSSEGERTSPACFTITENADVKKVHVTPCSLMNAIVEQDFLKLDSRRLGGTRADKSIRGRIAMSKSQRCGFISLLYSIADKPLRLWSKHISLDGRIRRVQEESLNGNKIIEIMGPHQTPVPTNISCPATPTDVLTIKLPILVLTIKNLELMFKFECQVIDKMQHRRRFTFCTDTPEKSPITVGNATFLPLKLDEGWNNLEMNFQTICTVVHGSDFQAFQRIIIYPNCRLRRVYFQDRHYDQDETPVQLCQAFFDMYMLKWGIHLVEVSCQTEEQYTGRLKPCDLENLTMESDTSFSIASPNDKSQNDFCSGQMKRNVGMNTLRVHAFIGHNRTVLVNDSESANKLEKGEEIHSYKSKLLRNECHSRIVKATTETKNNKQQLNPKNERPEQVKKKIGQKFPKNKKQHASKEKAHENRGKSEVCKHRQGLVELFPYKQDNEFLNTNIGKSSFGPKTKRDSNTLPGRPVEFDKIRETESKVKSKPRGNQRSKTEANNIKETRKAHVSSPHCGANFKIINYPVTSEQGHTMIPRANFNANKIKAEKNSSDADKIETDHKSRSCDVKTIQEIISEVRKIRKQLGHRDYSQSNDAEVEKSNLEDVAKVLPPVVEMQAKPSDTTSKKIVLSTDQAVGDFLEFRHSVNQKILEKFQDRGFTMTDIELSIYNSKHRRNCYGQGKLIESKKGHNDKGSGVGLAKPLAMDVSLRKKRLQLNDNICTQLRNELDAMLVQLKTNDVCMTPKMIDDTMARITRNVSGISNLDSVTDRQSDHMTEKTHGIEGMMERKRKIPTLPKNLKNTADLNNNFIKDSGKVSPAQPINILFQGQMQH